MQGVRVTGASLQAIEMSGSPKPICGSLAMPRRFILHMKVPPWQAESFAREDRPRVA